MLKKILRKMATGDAHSHADLAQQLEISEDLLARMLETLAHKGYLVPLATPEDSACRACGLHKACSHCPSQAVAEPRGWMLTTKGRAAAQSPESQG